MSSASKTLPRAICRPVQYAHSPILNVAKPLARISSKGKRELTDVEITVKENAFKQMQKDLKALAEDVLCYAENEYPQELRKQYPTYDRRYNRDTEIARRVLNKPLNDQDRLD